MTFLRFVLRRAARHWQILLTLILGVFLSTSLLAAAPVLVNTVIEFGLRRALLSPDPLAGNLRLKAFGRMEAAEFQAAHQNVQTILQNRLAGQLDQVIPTVGAQWLSPWVDEQIVPDERIIFGFYGYGETDINQQVAFVAGGWPTQDAGEGVITAVIGEEMAAAYNLEVGERLPLSARRDETQPSFYLLVSGIARPLETQSPYWFGEFSPLRAQSDERWTAQFTALLPPDQFFPVANRYFSGASHQFFWHVLLDPARFRSADITALQAQLGQLPDDLRGTSPAINPESKLVDVLANFATQATAVRAPLYFLTAEVVLLTLYYVIMVAALAVRQVEREFAVLQSRGASGGQIFRIQTAEALLIAGLAFVSGPLLAVTLVRGLTIMGPLADVGEAGWGLSLPQTAWLAAGVAAVACIVGLLLPVRRAIERSIVVYQQSTIRNEERPFWQRYYLDVFLLAVGLILLWRLHFYGSLVGGTAVRPRVDWLLLLSPIALLLGSGTILLRLFPLFLRFLATLAAQGRGLSAALAMWQAARNPNHAARLVLLLTLAISLGILTTGINATLDSSELERAQYTAGSDVRLVSRRAVLPSQVATLPNITAVTNLWRGTGSVSLGREYLRFDVLAIDPATFASQTHYRADFAAQPVPQLIDLLAVEELQTQPTLPLPGEPVRLGVWVWSTPDDEEDAFFQFLQGDSNLDRLGLEAKLFTAQGEALSVDFETAESGGYPADGWRYFEAELPRFPAAAYPLALESVWIRNRARTEGPFPTPTSNFYELALDDLTVVGAETAEPQLAYGFETLEPVWQLSDAALTIRTTQLAHSGQASQKMELGLGELEAVALKLVAPPRTDPLPVLVSQAFLVGTETAVGDILNASINSQPLQLRVVGAVNYFPTLYEDLNAGFVVTHYTLILDYLNRASNRPINGNEALIQVTDHIAPTSVGETALATISGLSQVWEVEAVRRTIKADPMALGLRSVTYFGYVLTTLLSLIGFATYFYMSARQKEAIYAVLRSIGMSPAQLYGSLVLEQVILILTGLAIGTLLGVALNQLTLPGLPITFGDRPPTPPFIAQNDWLAIGRIYLTLTVAFLFSLGIATTLLWRTQLHRVLRVGEE